MVASTKYFKKKREMREVLKVNVLLRDEATGGFIDERNRGKVKSWFFLKNK